MPSSGLAWWTSYVSCHRELDQLGPGEVLIIESIMKYAIIYILYIYIIYSVRNKRQNEDKQEMLKYI